MRAKTVTKELARLPAELLAKVQAEAEQDADDVAEFIHRAAMRCSAKSPISQAIYLPREALLGLGLAMRLHRWERIGLPIQLAFGLPSSTEVVKFVTHKMRGARLTELVDVLSNAVAQVVIQFLQWSMSDCELQCDLAIVAQFDEELLLDAVADLVWQVAEQQQRAERPIR